MQTKEAAVRDSRLKVTSWDGLITGALLEKEPNWVIQIGTKSKFSVLYTATILARLGGNRHSVISVVPDASSLPRRKNICYLEGEPLDSLVLASMNNQIRPEDKVMVILEDGLPSHPLVEIQTYAPLVTDRGYLVLGSEIDAFAMKCVEFEPDWIVTRPQLYLKRSISFSERFDDPPRRLTDLRGS